jgi:hypothetical protein
VTRAKRELAKTLQNLANHKFDTSKYILMKAGVSRDASTGRLVERKTAAAESKTKSK